MPHHIERVFSKIFQIGDGHCNAVLIKLKNNSGLACMHIFMPMAGKELRVGEFEFVNERFLKTFGFGLKV